MPSNIFAVAAALRRFPVFRRASLRQLADIVRLAWRDVTRVSRGATADVDAVFILLLEGRALVANYRVMRPGDLHYTGEDAIVDPSAKARATGERPPAAHAFTTALADRPVPVVGRSADGALVLPIRARVVERALRASASFCTSVALDPLAEAGPFADVLATMNPSWELVWMCCDPAVDAPMEALTRLLAAAVATEFSHRVAVVVFDAGGLRYAIWDHDGFTAMQPMNPDLRVEFGDLQYRIFVVSPTNPNVPPPPLRQYFFDRIVYVTTAVPKCVPVELGIHLDPGALDPADDAAPYFSSFVPSILLNGGALPDLRSDVQPFCPFVRAIARDGLSSWPAPISTLLGADTNGFATEVLDEQRRDPTTGGITPPRSALDRDSCRLRFTLTDVAQRWEEAVATDTVHAFHRAAFADAACARTAARWARAVSNKRVGLAVTGDGATSYRVVALLRMLEDAGVPVDVFGGLSGGANLGAYYCRDGAKGLDHYVGQGGKWRSIFNALLASATSQGIESSLDWAFSDTTLDDLEVRFLAVTTALKECGPPESHVVVRGTLGAAVRASGSLPIFFARTVKDGVIYSDGALANPMPVRALPNYGADYVIACDSVPGPDNRNPLRYWPLGDFLYRFTHFGHFIDVWVANQYVQQRQAEEAASYADVAVSTTPNALGLLEVMLWMKPDALLRAAARDPRMLAGLEAIKDFWNRRKAT